MICASCEHSQGTPSAHTNDGFTHAETGLFFCFECASGLISWYLDGGTIEYPDAYEWAGISAKDVAAMREP
jgi:hypothetical protein